MNMRGVFLVIFAWLTPALCTSPDPSKIELSVRQITNNIYMLTGTGGVVGNMIASTGPDGTLLVDTGYEQLADKIESAIRKVNPAPIRFVVNTHFHQDHTGANAAFAAKGATVIAHENVRKRLAQLSATNTMCLPIVTFVKTVSLYLNGDEIRLVHYGRGHTDGDCVVHFVRANVVHMGDHFFNFGFPFVDLENGGSVDGYIRILAAVLETIPPDAKIVPGHGPLTTVDDLRMYHQMLVETVETVRKAKAAGNKLDAIKRIGLPDKWKQVGGNTENAAFWIETVYRDTSTN